MIRRWGGLAVLGAAFTLGACASDQVATTSRPGGELAGVLCPPAGTVVTRDNGSRLRYGGSDPSDPATCLIGTPAGNTVKALGGLIVVHPVNATQRRQALASLFPLAPGRSSYTRYNLVNSLSPMANQNPFEESFRVVGETPVQLATETRQAWIVEGRLNSSMDANIRFVSNYHIDKQTGAVLAFTNRSATMGNVGTASLPYRVLDISVPGQQVASAP